MRIPSGYAQATVFWGGNALPRGAAVTLGLDVSGYAGNPQTLAELVDTAIGERTLLLGYTSEGCVVRLIRVKYGPNETGLSYDHEPVGLAGTYSGEVSPQVATLVRKVTTTGGRRGRGRMYWPGTPLASITTFGTWNDTHREEITDEFNALLAKLTTDDAVPVLLHSESTPASVPPYEITSMVCDTRVATQRRRLR